MPEFKTFAKFITSDAHREHFTKGHLAEEWATMYPMLFDANDLQIALNQREHGYHYYEWFAAILIYHTSGLLSLVEGYAYKSHERKRKILETLATGESFDFIASSGVSAYPQGPDLIVYSPESKYWFFCEVKGPRDKLRAKQVQYFKELIHVTGREIMVVYFQNSNTQTPPID